MEQSEIEKLIGELEIALDRLRSLYEQYFLGIERIEPGVPRKDVERRIYALRREQIRNTALRFRFQMVLQKFNTYQTHWQRVCREIENGTYKRHLLRAERRFGSSRPPSRRRSSIPAAGVLPEPGAPLSNDVAAELAELDADFAPASIDVDVEVDSRPSSRPPPRPTPRPRAPQGVQVSNPSVPRPAGVPPVWKKVAPPGGQPVPPAARPVPPGLPAQRPPPPAPSVPRAPAPPAPHAAPPRQPPRPAPPATASAPRPPEPRPVPPPDPEPPRPPPPRPSLSVAPPRPAPPSSELSEKRLRQIYVEYVDAKRRQNESTAAITYQSVARSLRESGDKLRQKHGKAVDFEVAVKDGKTILRPVLK